MPQWYWASASCIGTSHVRSATRKQDASISFVCGASDNVFVSIVSDGAGSASHGGEGASLVCRAMSSSIRRYFRTSVELPADELIWLWLDDVRDRIGLAAERRNLMKRDFAATMICLITDGNLSVVAHVGDGSAVARKASDQTWEAVSWPHHGQYASTTYFVTDDPVVQLRITRFESEIDAIALFSDGIERLALEFAQKRPFLPFFRNLVAPVQAITVPGLDISLSKKLNAYLNSEPINQRTNDDKTLVISIRK